MTFAAVEAAGVERILDQLREELVQRTYRPQQVRKVEIPKGGSKMRQLSIPSIRDRVVQGALKLILEPIFEADFQPGSFGYRPKKSAHTAIQRVTTAILAYHLTPHIDQLAADGMMFTQGYASAPLCSPSRGALLSGKYPARTKLTTVWDSGEQPPDERLLEVSKPILARMIQRGNAQYREGRQRHALPLSEYTFAQALRDGGYATAHFGKWHVGLQPGFRPQDRGFSVAAGTGKHSKDLPDTSARTLREDSPAWRI